MTATEETTIVDVLSDPHFMRLAAAYNSAPAWEPKHQIKGPRIIAATAMLAATAGKLLIESKDEDKGASIEKCLGAFAAEYMKLGGFGNSKAAIQAIATERVRQINKFGPQTHRSSEQWYDILMEEVGEVHRERCELMFNREKRSEADNIEDASERRSAIEAVRDEESEIMVRHNKECIEVAAVSFAWAEAELKRAYKPWARR